MIYFQVKRSKNDSFLDQKNMSNITTISTTTSASAAAEAQLVILYNLMIQNLSRVLDCFIWIVGHIGAICVCIVFSQPVFRKSPCAMYFIASSISQIVLFNFAVFIRLIQYGYDVPVNSLDAWFCRIRYYLFYASGAVARYNIIFAGIDRFLCSSQVTRLRQCSSPKIALRVIIINAIFWIIFYIQVLVNFSVSGDKCRITTDEFRRYFNLFFLIENGIFPVFPMAIFGLLTIRNIRQSSERAKAGADGSVDGSQSVTNTNTGGHKKETQLHRMLINQIIVFIVLTLPSPAYSIYRTYFLNTSTLSGSGALMDTFLNNLFFDCIYLNYALTCLTFLFTSAMFRRELKQVIQKIIFCRHRQHISPIT